MLYVINTGVLTSFCSLTALALYAKYPDNLIFLAVEFPMTKLYVNAFLAMFNARRHLQAAMDKTMITTNRDAFGPVTVKIPGQTGPAEKNTSPPGTRKSGLFGTLVFSHSVAESESGILSAERSVSEDGGFLSAEDKRPGDSNV